MVRMLTAPLRWFVIACVVLAIWQTYNGDPAAIAHALWGWVQTGADFISQIFAYARNA